MSRILPASDPKRILIVDDNRMGLSARRNVLEALGHTIVTAGNGQEALEQFDKCEGSFDLVLTDFRMPNMDGVELIVELRTRKASLPVILISGFADTLGLNEENTKADVVLQKSNNEVAQMVRAVSRLLSKPPKKPAGSQRSSGGGAAGSKRRSVT
jgi:two-component system, cell cycle sensor histidine kinase and response regulator CckA